MIDLQVLADASRERTSRPAAILFSVSSMRGAAGGADVHLEGAGIDLGEELAPQLRAQADHDGDQQPDGDADRQQAVPHDAI